MQSHDMREQKNIQEIITKLCDRYKNTDMYQVPRHKFPLLGQEWKMLEEDI